MGRDKSLSDDYPSVIINRVRYHYGRDPEEGIYLVENAFIAKDYWWFKRKEDMVAFLVCLPESADRNRLRTIYPDWHDVTHEQRGAYMEEDRARLRALADEKLKAGTAQQFEMDLDGQNGPHIPQRVAAVGRTPDDRHWVAGVWGGATPPFYGGKILFQDHVMAPLGGLARIPGPGARPQYVMAEFLGAVQETTFAVVVGATKDREYALSRAEQYERGSVPVQSPFAEWERGPELEEATYELGRIVVNPEAQGILNPDDVKAALRGHAAGHWDQVDTRTRMEQDEATATRDRGSVTSIRFDRDGNEFWVTTDGDRTVTTVSLAPGFEQEPLEQRRQGQRAEEPRRPERGLPEREGREEKTWYMLLHVEGLDPDGSTGRGRVVRNCTELEEAQALRKKCPGLVISRRTGPRPLERGDI